MNKIYQIAIDGPSGAGKSTIAKLVASKLNVDYIDTGAMYRAVGYKMSKLNVNPDDTQKIAAILEKTDIDFNKGKILLDGSDVSNLIRIPEIASKASLFAKIPEVRTKLVEIQRKIAGQKSVVMDGRDIGTVVLKDSKSKFYLTATVEERARRRYEELKENGEDVSIQEIEESIKKRDYDDMHRDISPLKKAEDAILIDSSNMSIDEVSDFVCNHLTPQ